MNRDSWLVERKKGIGASEVAAILGISPWRSAYDVWLDKVGQAIEQEQNDAMAYGLMVEPVIRQWYANKTGQVVSFNEYQVIRSPEFSFMQCTPDGMTSDRNVQIKTARSSEDWGEPGTDEIPDYYRVQVEHEMIVLGCELTDVVVSFSGTMPVIYTVEADAELSEMIIEEEAAFWRRVQEMDPPDPVTASDILQRFPISSGKSIMANDDIEQAVSMIVELQAINKGNAATIEGLKAEVMKYMGEHDTLINAAQRPLVTWKTSKKLKTRRFLIKGE